MTEKTLIEFPCDFPVKIIGCNTAEFLADVNNIISKHFPDFVQKNLQSKSSKDNNFLAITATVHVTSQKSLDLFYRDLTQIADVKMVL